MTEKFLGVIERSSVAAGFLVADSALKAGNVRRLLSHSIGSGNSRVLVAGDVSGMKSAVDAGAEAADGCLIGSIVITSIYPDVITAPGRTSVAPPSGAPGMLEPFNLATLIRAADACAKCAPGQLLEVRVAMAPGGKAFVTMTGDIAAAQTAAAAGRADFAAAGMLVNAAVIARPHPEVYREGI